MQQDTPLQKTLLITGSTDGIGLETAKSLLTAGHRVLLHGRNPDKVKASAEQLAGLGTGDPIETFVADLAKLPEVYQLAANVRQRVGTIDVLINNAGIFKTPHRIAANGVDMRFMVNAIAPWVLSRQLHPALSDDARIINLSSAAQAPVNLRALRGEETIADDFNAYAQSKLALTMWSMDTAALPLSANQSIVAVNPASMLASKMVKEGFASAGKDIGIGVRILHQLATGPEAIRSHQYFDNDQGKYAAPHPNALNADTRGAVLAAMAEAIMGAMEG